VFTLLPPNTPPTSGLGAAKTGYLTSSAWVDPNYLSATNPYHTIDDFHFQAQTNYPPGNSFTNNYHIGVSDTHLPDYVAAANDLHLRIDGDSGFTAIPAPGTTLLIGAGLLAAGLGARRRKTRA